MPYRPHVLRLVRWLPLTVLAAVALSAAAANEENEEKESSTRAVETVLALGPIQWTGQFAWDKAKNAGDMKANLAYQLRQLPRPGQAFTVLGRDYVWTSRGAGGGGAGLKDGGLTVLSFNMESWRYTAGKLKLAWQGEADVFCNGSKLSGSVKDGFDVKAETGSYHFLAMLAKAGDQEDFSLGVEWESKHAVDFHADPERRLSPEQLYHAATVEGLDLSPDGKWAALAMRGYDRAKGKWENWLEVRDAATGEVWQRWRGEAPNGQWSPDSKRIAYMSGGDLWVEDIASREAKKLLSNPKGAGGFTWHPDGGSLFFTWQTVKGEPRKDGMKRYRALEDRWGGWRNRSQVFQVDAASGWLRQITDGEASYGVMDIHPDGSKMLVAATPVDYAEPPHSLTVVEEVDTATGERVELLRSRFIGNALYAKDGLYVIGGPSMFEGAGLAGKDGALPSGFDTQLYFYNPKTKKAKALSKAFDPSISSAERLENGDLLLSAAVSDETRLYRYNARQGSFRELSQPLRVVQSFAVSKGKNPVMIWRGSSASVPQKVYISAVEPFAPRAFADPAPEAYGQTRLGEVKGWTFQNRHGDTIDGRFYLPPDFDPQKKHPLIVYYYGGVVPVSEQFTGRYPFNLWAAQGYVIYVVQPAGAIGYGQKFSEKHVNAWGKETAEDIIEGAKAFLAAHDFVDADKVGCIGASYGGFMTMYLATQTDMFAAAISHAGISNLVSYWGKGWWGYLYSGFASRGSFPWNNPDLYVKQSPVFNADKTAAPLLLLHGTADTNVPAAESHIMYTALKLLGKDVELITVEGEDHWIIENSKRMAWWDTILAYFDKYLKQQPEWWEALYPN